MSERDVRMYNPTHRHLQRRSGMPPTDEPVVRWDQQFQDNVMGVVVCDRRVYVSTGFDIVAMDHDGTGRWRFETGDWVYSSPAVVDGTVFVGSNDENVYALGGDATGAERVGDTEAYDPCPNPTCEVNLSKYRYESEVNFCPVCGTELRAEEGSDTRVYDPR